MARVPASAMSWGIHARMLWLTVLLLGALPAPALSAEPGTQTEPVVPANYVLAPGDVIEITVSSHEGFDRVMRIQPDGRIQFPGIGEVIAAGLTTSQVAARLYERLNVELVEPRVTVSIKEARTDAAHQVTILGAVRNQGVFPLKGKSTLLDLLATAGGLQAEADLTRITITRADRSRIRTIDFSRVAQTGRADEDVLLEPGDLVVVPTNAPQKITVQVTGEVTRPGAHEISRDSRIMDAIADAGGLTPKADLSKVRLIRAGQTQVLNLLKGATEDAAGLPANLTLQPGDRILLPENENSVHLLGSVARPDAYPLREGDSLFDLLTRSGGTTPAADLGKCLLIRRDEQGKPVAQKLNLKPMLTKGDMKANRPLQRGDVVLIPSKTARHSKGLAGIFQPLLSLLGLVTYGL